MCVKIQAYGSAESTIGEEIIIQQRLFNTDGDLENRSYINIGASISISSTKFMMFDYSKDVIAEASKNLKNSCLHYSGNNQMFKVDVESPSLQTREPDQTYKLVLHLYSHGWNYQ